MCFIRRLLSSVQPPDHPHQHRLNSKTITLSTTATATSHHSSRQREMTHQLDHQAFGSRSLPATSRPVATTPMGYHLHRVNHHRLTRIASRAIISTSTYELLSLQPSLNFPSRAAVILPLILLLDSPLSLLLSMAFRIIARAPVHLHGLARVLTISKRLKTIYDKC